MGAISDGISDKRYRLYSRMHFQITALRAKTVLARIAPQIGSVAAVLAELYIVDMRCCARLKDEDKLMLRAIQRAHAAIGFRPNDMFLSFE